MMFPNMHRYRENGWFEGYKKNMLETTIVKTDTKGGVKTKRKLVIKLGYAKVESLKPSH